MALEEMKVEKGLIFNRRRRRRIWKSGVVTGNRGFDQKKKRIEDNSVLFSGNVMPWWTPLVTPQHLD